VTVGYHAPCGAHYARRVVATHRTTAPEYSGSRWLARSLFPAGARAIVERRRPRKQSFGRWRRQDRALRPAQSGSPDSRRSPEVRPTAFTARPPDLPPRSLMAVDFAVIGSLARTRRPGIRFLSIGQRLCSTLPSDAASRRRPCASLILRQPPSGWMEDFHLQAVDHARHTKRTPRAA
jgi:hypothetical protein